MKNEKQIQEFEDKESLTLAMKNIQRSLIEGESQAIFDINSAL
jgi:hypothetical protein